MESPLLRKHEETLRFFMQELEAVSANFESQLSILDTFHDCFKPQSFAEGLPHLEGFPSLNRNPRREGLVRQYQSHLEYSIAQRGALMHTANELSNWHHSQITGNKDDPEAAIMTFTVVTVIFLPLSFLASFFGMNTHDVREMKLGQWIYWVFAIPLTFAVVIGSFWWVGRLYNIIDRALRALPKLKKSLGYKRSLGKPVTWADKPDTDKEKKSRRRGCASPGRINRIERHDMTTENPYKQPEVLRRQYPPSSYGRDR